MATAFFFFDVFFLEVFFFAPFFAAIVLSLHGGPLAASADSQRPAAACQRL
jgi:hypothetical protein